MHAVSDAMLWPAGCNGIPGRRLHAASTAATSPQLLRSTKGRQRQAATGGGEGEGEAEAALTGVARGSKAA